MRVASLTLTALLGLVVLTGCTRVLDISGSEWKRANTPIRDVTWDEVECARETDGKGELPDTIVGGVVDAFVVPLEDRRRGSAYDRCMHAKGYTPVSAQSSQ
jgi:hypothetical protein